MEEEIVFRELAPLMRAQPQIQALCRFGAQWASPHAPEEPGWGAFHIVCLGKAWLEVAGAGGVRLEPGDVAVLPHGGRHVVRAMAGNSGVPAPIRTEKRRSDRIAIKTNVTQDADTKLICGRLRFERVRENFVLCALPPLVVLADRDGPDAAQVRRLVETMEDHVQEDRFGAATIASQLATAVMVIVLRAHFRGAGGAPGPLALLSERATARALSAMLADPGRNWTLDDLAEHAAVSRASLVRLFQKAVSQPPLAFLTELRLTLAHRRLHASDASVGAIAQEFGYSSESAFARAYRRRFSKSPASERSVRPAAD